MYHCGTARKDWQHQIFAVKSKLTIAKTITLYNLIKNSENSIVKSNPSSTIIVLKELFLLFTRHPNVWLFKEIFQEYYKNA